MIKMKLRNFDKIMLLSLVFLAVSLSIIPAATPKCGLASSTQASQISQNEPWYCPINQQIYSEWSNYLPIALLVVFISFGIAGIIFMAGVALNSNKIRNFGIGEFYEALATAIIIAAFLYLCAVVFGILPGTYVGKINPYATAFNLMTQTIGTAEQMYTALFKVYLSVSYVTSTSVTIAFGGTLGKSASTLLNILDFIPQIFVNAVTIPATIYFLDPAVAIALFLTDGIMALYAEYYLLLFFSIAAIPVFLIPGVIFRAIFPTRALGGILIAMAFGFYLIMPSLFAVAYYFTAPTVQRDMGLSTLQMQSLNALPNSVTSQSSPLVQQLSGVKSSLNGFWLMIFFYPALIIAITYTMIREIANFVGRAAQVSGRLRVFI